MRLQKTTWILAIAIAGCSSFPDDGGSNWRGYTKGKVEVQLQYSSAQLPSTGWLVESAANEGSGSVSFTTWGAPGYKYKKRGSFKVEPKWRANANNLGLLKTRDGFIEFCALNSEHGAFVDGDSIVHTRSWDLCARLLRE